MHRFCDYKNAFRILKGGKISLVVSAFLTTATLVHAAPTGGVVTSGTATISQSGNVTNINQSSNKSIINWQNFNVAGNETVNINMPSSTSTSLNRIVGNEASSIYGVVNSNGQVFLVNPNGVYFGKDSKVNTAGFVATTKDIKDEDFLNGNYVFEGSSNASIINFGTITTPNAYTALLAKKVENEGVIKATLGQVHLASGDKFTLDVNGNSLLKLTIDKGVIDGLVANKGAIIADGGQIYMTTSALGEVLNGLVNNTGLIQANSVEEKDGKVILFAHGGTAEIGGTIEAKGGFVETSGEKIELKDDIKIKTKKWLIDPYDVEIVSDSVTETSITPEIVDQTKTYTAPSDSTKIKASTLMTALNEGTDVIVTTSGNGTQNGDIFVNSAITWNSANGLYLEADRNIYINSAITARNDSGKLYLYYGQGAVASNNTANYYVNAPINLKSGQNFTTNLGSDGSDVRYSVITDPTALQNINSAPTDNYVLGDNIDMSSITNFTPIHGPNSYMPMFRGNVLTEEQYNALPIQEQWNYMPRQGTYSGIFDGLGHNISHLNINLPNNSNVALFGQLDTAGIIRNIGLTDVTITGSYAVGGLVGVSNGTISNSYASGSITGSEAVGGLVGVSQGTITGSYSTANVLSNVSQGGNYFGGLVGANYGTITNSYATGDVNANSSWSVAGLAGLNANGNIFDSYTTGNVIGNQYVGGLVGQFSGGTISRTYSIGSVTGNESGLNIGGLIGGGSTTITNSFWNTETSGKSTSAGGDGVVGKTTAEMKTLSTYTNAGWSISGTDGVYPTFATSGANVWTMASPIITLNYTLSDILSGYIYSGNEVTLNSLWNASSIFGSNYSSWIYGTDYSFIYGGNPITSFTNAGTYSGITVDILKSGYTEAGSGNTSGSLVIAKKALTITNTTAGDKIYDGTTDVTTTVGTLSGFVGNETVSTSAVGTFASKDAGRRTATFVYTLVDGENGGLANNYSLENTTADAQIAKKALTITNTIADDKIYDGTTDVTTTVGTLSGFVGNETVSTSAVGTFASKDAGRRTATFVYTLVDGENGGLANNYSLENTTADAQIAKKALIVTAQNDSMVEESKVYNGGNGVTYSGFVDGENQNVLGGTLTYNGSSQGAKNKGDYVINPNGLTSNNYDVSYKDGKLTVTPDTTKTTKTETPTGDNLGTKGNNPQIANGEIVNKIVIDGSNLGDSFIKAKLTVKEYKDQGTLATELKTQGYNVSELKEGGYTAKDLKDAGYSINELKDAGFSADELKTAGFSSLQLKRAGF